MASQYGPPADPIFLALKDDPDPYQFMLPDFRYLNLTCPIGENIAPVIEQPCVLTLDEMQETASDGKVSDLRVLLMSASANHRSPSMLLRNYAR